MKITFPDGTTRVVPFSPSACCGYRARAIELSTADGAALRNLALQPQAFLAAMTQLVYRFNTEESGK